MNAKNNDENNSIRNNIHEIWSKICFVSAVTFVWKGFLSSEISQFRQLIDEKTVTSVFTGNPKFKQEYFFWLIRYRQVNLLENSWKIDGISSKVISLKIW